MQPFDAARPLRVVALFSGGASAVRYLTDHHTPGGDSYTVVGAVSSDPEARGIGPLRTRGIEVRQNDIEAFTAARNTAPEDMAVREAFDRRTHDLIDAWNPDLVLLSGYMWILTDPMISPYPVLNVHPADLTVTDETGDRRYVGADPVADAVTAGASETRSTVHFVTTEVDEGPILVRSKPFPIHTDLVTALEDYDATEALDQYVAAHQEWMKWEGDGPCIAKALELIADGRVERDGSTAIVDGEAGHYELETGAVE